MRKQKGDGGRSKNRPSSSSLAASLVPPGASGFGFGGYHGSSRVESFSSSEESPSILNVDNEVAQHLKRLGRKDPTTKVKTLTALSFLFKQKSAEEVVQIVPQWAYEYKRLLLDYNWEVRRATHDAMGTLVAAVRRGLAPHLKYLMGPWWFAQFDPVPEVSQAAKCSFETAFPAPEKKLDALILCVDEIFSYLDENLKLTPLAMSDKATPMDELEDMHHRVISSSLLAVTTLIDIILSKKLETTSESINFQQKHASKARITLTASAEQLFSVHNCFLDFLKYKNPAVRSATYSALTIYIKNIPHAYNEENMKSMSAAILGAFQEKDMLCHSSMWDMILLFSRKFPDAWYYNNIHKIVLNKLWQFLRNGCYGSHKVSYPSLVILLESLPPKAVNGEQFLLNFFQNLWAGRNPSHSSATDSATFFKAFKECLFWVLDNATRFSKSEEDKTLSKKLVNDILVMILWYDYIQMIPKNKGESSLEIADAGVEGVQLSDDRSAEAPNYPSSYIQELGKSIVGILSHLSLKELNLLHDCCATIVRDCLVILQHRIYSKRSQELLRRIINFFLLLGQLPLQKGLNWPWEFLAGPLIASSFTIIKSLDSLDAVKLVSVLIGIFGLVNVLSHIHACNKEHSSINSTSKCDGDLRAKRFLQTFNDDFVPWCLAKHTNSSGAKLDLLLSLVQDEYLYEQWCAIIKHFAQLEQCSRTDTVSSNHADDLQSFAIIFEKFREKIRFMKMENVHRFGALPEHWHHEWLDSAVISFVCEAPCFCFSHAQLLRAILGGSVEDDKICFLSRKAVTVIFEEILKMLVLYLTKSSFKWTRPLCSVLLSLPSMELTVIHKLVFVDNVEVAQYAFQVLEGSFFCLKMLDGNSALISSIVAALFIIDLECSLSSLNVNSNHAQNHHATELQMLSDSQINIGDHVTEQVDSKMYLIRRVHAFCHNILTGFSSIVNLCNLTELRTILIQTTRFTVFEMDRLSSDVTSLCSKWVMDFMEVTCQDSSQFQCMLDQLLSQDNSWPLWVAPLFQEGSRTATVQCLRAHDEINERRHENFVAFADKLISDLGVWKVIAGSTGEASVKDAPSLLPPCSRVWLAAELLCTWRWKGGNALDSLIPSLSKYAKYEYSSSGGLIISSLVNVLFDGALVDGANSHWVAFCSWITSDEGFDNIQDPFLRALLFLLHTFLVKDNIWEMHEAANFFKHVINKLFISNHVDRAHLRILPFVMSYVVRSLVLEREEFDGSTKDCSLMPSEALVLYENIINWLHKVDAFPPLHLLETGNEEAADLVLVVLSCYPLISQGGIGGLKIEVLRDISDLEQKLLLSLFRKQRSAAPASAKDEMTAMASLSNLSFVSPMQVEMIIAKLTAVTVAYCWEVFEEEDWSYVFVKLPKWLESSVLLMEETAERVDDAMMTYTTDNMEVISMKLEEVVQPFDPLSASVSATALITFFLFSELIALQKVDGIEVLQSIKHGKWVQVKDQIMENVLRLFFTTGLVEAIAKSCSDETSSVIAARRLDYSLFWDLIASLVINTPEHVRTKAVESMELWGLSKGPISSLYAVLFSSKSFYSLQVAAYRLLSTKPIIHLSILKENLLESNDIASQEPHLLTNMDITSEGSLCLRDEISCLILKPEAELLEMELIGHDRVNVFLSWILLLTHLYSLPSSSTSRERLVQFIQDSVSSTILDCLFQHIPLKLVATSLKRKDMELSGDALQAANAAKHAINMGSLLLSMESLWPIGTEHMASLAGSIYGMMIQLLPSYVRNWFTSLRDRSVSSAIEFFTKVWCSPCLLSDELSQLKETVLADENFSISVNKSAYEIVATYKKEETGMDLVIRLPSCYPLRPVDVECTRNLGVSEVKQMKWLLSLTAFVRNQLHKRKEGSSEANGVLWRGSQDFPFPKSSSRPFILHRMVPLLRPSVSGKVILIRNSKDLRSAPFVTASYILLIIAFHVYLARPANTSFILLVCTSGSRPLTNQHVHYARLHFELLLRQILFYRKSSTETNSKIVHRLHTGRLKLWHLTRRAYWQHVVA